MNLQARIKFFLYGVYGNYFVISSYVLKRLFISEEKVLVWQELSTLINRLYYSFFLIISCLVVERSLRIIKQKKGNNNSRPDYYLMLQLIILSGSFLVGIYLTFDYLYRDSEFKAWLLGIIVSIIWERFCYCFATLLAGLLVDSSNVFQDLQMDTERHLFTIS